MATSKSQQPRQWIKWYESHGQDVKLTCEHFGISRATFYRWLKKYRENPERPLRRQSRRPKSQRVPSWTVGDLWKVADICHSHPSWGRKPVYRAFIKQHGPRLSEATIGRMMRLVSRKCPFCEGTNGRHNLIGHLGAAYNTWCPESFLNQRVSTSILLRSVRRLKHLHRREIERKAREFAARMAKGWIDEGIPDSVYLPPIPTDIKNAIKAGQSVEEIAFGKETLSNTGSAVDEALMTRQMDILMQQLAEEDNGGA